MMVNSPRSNFADIGPTRQTQTRINFTYFVNFLIFLTYQKGTSLRQNQEDKLQHKNSETSTP